MSIAVAHVPLGAATSPSKYYHRDNDHICKQERAHNIYSSTPNSSCGDSSRDSADLKSTTSSISPDLPQDQHHHYSHHYPRHPLDIGRGHRSSNIYGNPGAAPGGNIVVSQNNNNSNNMPSAFGSLDGVEGHHGYMGQDIYRRCFHSLTPGPDSVKLYNLDSVKLYNLDSVKLYNLDSVKLYNLDSVKLYNLDSVKLYNLDSVKLYNLDSDRRPDLVGSHGGFGHLVSSGSGSFSTAPRLSHTPGGATDFQPPYFPPPYQPQQDFHHHQVDPYSHVNPFQQAPQHYNQLHPSDRNVLARRDDPLNMHPGLGGYDTRRPDYMTGLRRPEVLHHPSHHGLGLDQDPSLLNLHSNPLAGLEDANQVSQSTNGQCIPTA
ncbi:hypothetical protein Btru_067397 [Bulinus truncatus]|nr:hypothetical protein Btru_067397 [Bulinus truncatus]